MAKIGGFWRRAAAVVLGAVLLLHAAPGASAATGPQTFTIEVGRELDIAGSDGERLSAVTLRFLPEEIQVHQGDTLHFTSEVPLQGIALLPPEAAQTCDEWTKAAAEEGRCEPRAWIERHAFSLESPWYPVTLDPDEDFAKVNNAAAFPPFPACGNRTYIPPQVHPSAPTPQVALDQRPCEFPLNADQRELQARRWGFADPDATHEDAKGILGSGIGQGGPARTLDFRVKVTSAPGTVFWAVSLFAKEAHLRVEVVPDDVVVPTAAEVLSAAAKRYALDQEAGSALDERFADYRRLIANDRGTHTWEALVGVEEGPVAIRQSYPKVLNIKRDDRVRWSSRYVHNLVHTVTFPGKRAFTEPFFTQVCDLDTDSGRAADVPSVLPAPVFCPGGHPQVEFDLGSLMGAPLGDGTHSGPGDEEHSGIRGMAPSLLKPGYPVVRPQAEYEVTFTAPSGPEGFAYACALHGSLNREMTGRVIVH